MDSLGGWCYLLEMPIEISRERLSDLLIDPREDLNFELKNWLDFQRSNESKAIFAKAVLAISNHGGGFIALGLTETARGFVEAEGRPASLDGYSQDLINGIVESYCDPPFHCAVHVVANPTGLMFPMVVVPGGHKVPIRAKRSGPNGNIVTNNSIYIRKPGPRSETPHSARDWDDLLKRCLLNQRNEMFDQIRDLFAGRVPQVEQIAEPARLEEWKSESFQRWRALIAHLPPDAGPRLTYGHYSFAYEITGERREIAPAIFPEVLRTSVVRHTGWPPFWYPTRNEIQPYPIDGAVECWLGGDTQSPTEERDPAHSDFWRIHPNGLAFLLRGFQEDGVNSRTAAGAPVAPATMFDINLPVWRVGETLLHARSLAANLFEGPTTIRFVIVYEGLSGRSLVSINNSRYVSEDRVARQNSIALSTHVEAETIDPNLAEIVHPLLLPLYALFGFFELPMQLVVDELSRMRAGNF